MREQLFTFLNQLLTRSKSPGNSNIWVKIKVLKGFRGVFSLSTQRIHWQKCLKQRFLLIYDLSFLIWKEEGGEMILSNQKSIFVWHTIMSTYGKVHHLSFSYFYIFLKVIFCSFWKPQKAFFVLLWNFAITLGMMPTADALQVSLSTLRLSKKLFCNPS